MIKRIILAIIILAFISLVLTVPLSIWLLNNYDEAIVDTIYSDIMVLIWGFGLVLAIFWRW